MPCIIKRPTQCIKPPSFGLSFMWESCLLQDSLKRSTLSTFSKSEESYSRATLWYSQSYCGSCPITSTWDGIGREMNHDSLTQGIEKS
mmetsp:Transcript_37008/g.89939  ORF Transcript_37008/g.89939 Transcript_37008/m.89939 type:complete len:88 (-) Transcript_37008:2538-2801(-)